MVLVAVGLLAACNKQDSKAPPPPKPALPADAGSTSRPAPRPLTIQVPSLPGQLNPLVQEADLWCHRIAMHNIFEPLVRLAGEAGVEPLLAERFSWEGEHRRRLRFTLREGVLFHDGRPLTATDVVYTIDHLLGRKSSNTELRARLHAVRQVHEVSPTVVELRLAYYDGQLPRALAAIGIVPAHRYRRFGLRSVRLNRAPIGTGPFRFAPTADPATLELVRNEQYWGKPALTERIVFRAIDEPGRTLAALRNDEVDIVPDLYTGYYPKHVGTERFKARFRLLRLHPFQLRVLLFNTRRRALADRRVRRALVQAIDRPQLLRAMRGELGQLLSAPLWPLSSWYDRTLHPRSFDRQAAARLLERAGWRLVKRACAGVACSRCGCGSCGRGATRRARSPTPWYVICRRWASSAASTWRTSSTFARSCVGGASISRCSGWPWGRTTTWGPTCTARAIATTGGTATRRSMRCSTACVRCRRRRTARDRGVACIAFSSRIRRWSCSTSRSS